MDSPHKSILEQQIGELEQLVLAMSSRVDDMVGRAVESLVTLDVVMAEETIAMDDEIDQYDLSIEEGCLRLLATRQPMARDLREIGTLMKIITDIERIGDYAVDVAKASRKIDAQGGTADYIDLRRMAALARDMFRKALASFVKRDLKMVEEVLDLEDDMDDLYRVLREQVHTHMRSNPDSVVAASWMLLAVHYIERVADHSVNIVERVAFMITGQFENLSLSHTDRGHHEIISGIDSGDSGSLNSL